MRDSIPILGPSSENSIVQTNPQRRVNLYLKQEAPGARSPYSLRHTPGLILVDTATGGVGRSNGIQFDAREFFVIGEMLVSVDANGLLSEVGTLLTSSGRVEMAAGRTYMMLTDGTYGYAYDGVTFTQNIQNTDPDFPDGPTHCRYIDGFFIVNESGTDNFYKSASEDPLDWDPLEFEVASAAPDNILAIEVYDRDLIALGQYTVQRYYNSGDPDFPYSPYPNTVQAGILAPHSVVPSVMGTIFLANTKDGYAAVVMLSGGSIDVISDADINDRIGGFTGLSSAIGSIYTQNGHTFYVITFPADNTTLVCDLSQNFMWHDRSSLIDGEAGRWRISGLGYLSGSKVYGVDYLNANLYELDLGTYTENEATIQRDNYAQIIHNNGNRLQIHSLEYVLNRGVGLITGQGSDPQLMLRVSKDGGQTYSPFRLKPFGTMGQYQKRSIFKRVGEYVEFNSHLRVTDPVPVDIMAAYADIEWTE